MCIICEQNRRKFMKISGWKPNLSIDDRFVLPARPPFIYPAILESAKPLPSRLATDKPVPKVVLVSEGKANLSTVV
jgi:hypothetical protein